MLAGCRPFDATSPAAVFQRHRLEGAPPMATRAPGASVPAAAESVAMRLIERLPGD